VLRVLHLTGSPVSDLLEDLSLLYARDCLSAVDDGELYDVHLAHVSPGGTWRFPADLSPAAIARADPMSAADGLARAADIEPDLMVPQMFCMPGMTEYRCAFDLLGVPYIGNPGAVMALATHKAQAKAVVAAAGVKVPLGEIVAAGHLPTLAPPFVVKPVLSDNSLGVTLVTDHAMAPRAIAEALQHGDEVLVEEFIPAGREVRAGCIVRNGEMMLLPLEEYPVDSRSAPIRTHEDKIGRTADGQLRLMAKGSGRAWIVPGTDPIATAVGAAVAACHSALGMRHYSLFDFRIDPDGTPWFLEASPYCSFARSSVLVTMADAAGIPVRELFADMAREACRR
jgi:D-alanine-D-alanine ligase